LTNRINSSAREKREKFRLCSISITFLLVVFLPAMLSLYFCQCSNMSNLMLSMPNTQLDTPISFYAIASTVLVAFCSTSNIHS
jgi:hypothetical protein